MKERLSVLICGALLFSIPSSLFAANTGVSKDISVRTIYFADGSSQSTATLQGPAGPQGPIGSEGQAGPTGATGTAGQQGVNGYNSLLSITDEMSGSNCANGGTKIQVGLDLDRSGVLDACEVLQTKYICNGAAPGTPPPGTITVTASPSTQTFNSFVNISATLPLGNYYGGNVYFSTSGSCMLYDASANSYNNFASQPVYGGIASVALVGNNSSGASVNVPCVVYANYYDYNTSVNLSGSALATFVPESSTPPTPPPATMTVTASPSTQTFGSFVNITATMPPGNYYGGSVYFSTSGSCMLYDATANSYNNFVSQPLYGGIASVALVGNNSSGTNVNVPCLVYANYYDYNTSGNLSGSALATFVPQAP